MMRSIFSYSEILLKIYYEFQWLKDNELFNYFSMTFLKIEMTKTSF